MPQGSVRSLIALTLTAAVIYGAVSLPLEQSGPLWGVYGFVIKSYFDARSSEQDDELSGD
jgi:hypothetical protein